MRKLIDVINQILEVAPDLEPEFASLRESVMYSAPELMPLRWKCAMDILNDCAIDHPKADKIAAIFSDGESCYDDAMSIAEK